MSHNAFRLPLTIPAGHEHSTFVVSVSGGKDSTATVLALRESGIPARYVFADTGWEFPPTYEYLDTLERILGIHIDRVGVPGGMRSRIASGARFPSRLQRWCTRELKIEPLRAYHDRVADETDTDTVNVVGIRADESASRAGLPEFEFHEKWGGYTWRPLIHATIADVLALHHRHGVPVNPLYRMGFSRVGCFCINASKEEIRLTAEHFPERIEEVERFEREGTAERARRNAEEPGRYAMETATFFQKTVKGDDGKRHGAPFPIREAVAWSRTKRGGVQLQLVQADPEGGCFRWGVCDPPEKSDLEAAAELGAPNGGAR